VNHCIFDTETFPNFTLACFEVVETGERFAVRLGEEGYLYKLREILESEYTFVGFNSYSFDNPVVAAILAGKSSEEVKRIANMIIEQELPPWKSYRQFGLKEPKYDHIDLIEVTPGFVGLKAYGARVNIPTFQDLPYEHDRILTEDEKEEVLKYCWNDIDTTKVLFKRLEGPLALRKAMSAEYGIDMRSKSDTQMAEQSFIKRLNLQRRENRVPYSISYKAPHFISFESETLQTLLARIQDTEFIMNQKTGHVILPDFLGKDLVRINAGSYQLGVGGIHSTHDKKVCHVAGDDYFITDIDAASYYPTIILNCGLVPQGGQAFLDTYREIYVRRLEAKAAKNKAVDAVLKISLNGTFGKLMERWSPLYAPELGLAVTLTGQLTLLCMIEQIEKTGAKVLSANTDGIAIGGTKVQMQAISTFVTKYSKFSGFDFEYTPYRVLAMGNVNNYIAVTLDKKVKAKGIYAPPTLQKNQTAPICAKAVSTWLVNGTPFERTIAEGSIVEFLSARNVTGGGKQGEHYLGRVVRWYYTTNTSFPPLTYAKNGNKVPKTEGARAAMIIDPESSLPEDLDFNWYRKEAIRIAKDIGASEFLTEEELKLVEPPPKVRKPRKVKEK
jgi:hypothetical protein